MTAPGWYPDPAGAQGLLRFFDGQGWTNRLREHPHAAPAQAPAAPPAPAQSLSQSPPLQRRSLAPEVPAPAAAPSPTQLQQVSSQQVQAPYPYAARPPQVQPQQVQPQQVQPQQAQPAAGPHTPSLAAQGLATPGAGSFAPAQVPGTWPHGAPAGPGVAAQPTLHHAPSQPAQRPGGFFLASERDTFTSAPALDPFAAFLAAQQAAGIPTDGPRSPAEGYGLDEDPDERLSFRALLGDTAPPARVGSYDAVLRTRPSWVQRVLSSIASLVMFVSMAGAGWIGWDLYGSSYYARSQQQEVQYSLGLGTSAQGLPGEDPTLSAPPTAPVPGQPAAGKPAAGQPAAGKPQPRVQVAPPPKPGAPVAPVPAGRAAAVGDAVARINIPAIGVDQAVFMGTDVPTLKRGPGIWRDGVLPGFPGNATISGHRTTHGGPFRRINELKEGDRISVAVPGQELAVYEVRAQFLVSPKHVAVTYQTEGARLTITTCDPVGSASKRRVIQAELVKGKYVKSALPRERWKVQK